MNFIENVLSHMSSTFNRESILPKQAEIAEDETFKWRALKNNQFASRSKHSQTKSFNKNIPSVTLAGSITTSNTANEIVIEIANGISNAEIQEALNHQSSSVECQIFNATDNRSELRIHKDDTCDKDDGHNGEIIRMHDVKAETVSTSNLFKHMSSTFNSTGEISIKNITELSGAVEMQSYENSGMINGTIINTVKDKLKTVRRSNRLKQDHSKNDCSDQREPRSTKCSQDDVNNLNSVSQDKDITTMETKLGDLKTLSIACTNTEVSACNESANLKMHKMSKLKKKKLKKLASTCSLSQLTAITTKARVSKSQNSSHTKHLNIERRLTTSKQHNYKLMSSAKDGPVKRNNDCSLNLYSKTENMCRLRGRLSRPIKLSAKILANKKLRHGFELQNSARLGCYSKEKVHSEHSPESKILLQTGHQTSVPHLKFSPSKKVDPEIKQFICEIKRLHLVNNKSPDINRNLSKTQLQQLMILKETHLRSLGLLSTQTYLKSKENPQKGQNVISNSVKIICSDAKNCNNQHKDENLIPYSKTKPFEKCLCEKRFPYFTTVHNNLQCTAIDDINGQLIMCGNKLKGKAQHFLRPGMRSSYQLLCVMHYKRFRRHGCCSQCGIYCSQVSKAKKNITVTE